MTRQRGKSLILSILVALCSLTSLAKDRDWTTGTLVASETERGTRTVGIPSMAGTMIATLPNDVTLYTIDDGKYVFVVSRRIVNRKREKPLELTVNTPVKFAIEKGDCYLLDEEGKEHKLVVEKKTLKTN